MAFAGDEINLAFWAVGSVAFFWFLALWIPTVAIRPFYLPFEHVVALGIGVALALCVAREHLKSLLVLIIFAGVLILLLP